MRRFTRRRFGALAGASALAMLTPHVARGQNKPRVMVIGGGAGGATAAKYLAASSLAVTLVEPNPHYTTCFFGNLYLAGLRSLASLTFGYDALAQRHGVNVIQDSAIAIDPSAKTVTLAGGTKLAYDRLVLATGIAFKFGAVDGYDEAAAQVLPHAWSGAPQLELLRRQIESMEDGGVFVLTVPPSPMRCPPAPYERASLVAYYLKQYKKRSKIIVLDAKDSFFAQDVFQDAWERHYAGLIEWLPGEFTGGVKSVDVKARAVKTGGDTFKGAVVNIIPPQAAGALARQAGLVDASGWCPVDLTFESRLQPGIHIIGDAAAAGDMPKSAFAANSQAKLCAFSIAAALTGSPPPTRHLLNACYTVLAPDDAVTEIMRFDGAAGAIKTADIFVSKVGETAEVRRHAAQEANAWYAAFTRDLFG